MQNASSNGRRLAQTHRYCDVVRWVMCSHSLIEWLREDAFFTLHHLCFCSGANHPWNQVNQLHWQDCFLSQPNDELSKNFSGPLDRKDRQ